MIEGKYKTGTVKVNCPNCAMKTHILIKPRLPSFGDRVIDTSICLGCREPFVSKQSWTYHIELFKVVGVDQ